MMPNYPSAEIDKVYLKESESAAARVQSASPQIAWSESGVTVRDLSRGLRVCMTDATWLVMMAS
jgi:hypothetical protein